MKTQTATAQTEAMWRERVRAWREAGVTVAEYAAGKQFAPSTLRYWASRLNRKASPRFVQVVRAAPVAAHDDAGLYVEIAGARVHVRRGFDVALLADVVRALRGSDR